MNAPTYLEWAAWFSMLGLVGALIPIVAWLLTQRIQGATARLAIWRGGFVMIAGLAVGESAGLFHFDSRELGAGQERTGAWTVVTESNPMQVPSVASEELSASFEGDERRAVVTWWNTRTWLPGTMLLMGFGLCSVYWCLFE